MFNKSILMALASLGSFATVGPSVAIARTLSSRTKQPAAKTGNRSGRPYQINTARQDARHAKKYYMATVNDFEIMQSRPSKEIAARELKLAA